MKSSYTIAERKDEILYVALHRKQVTFSQCLVQLFVGNIKGKDEIFCLITAKTSHWSTFR